jgi:hypothetical protein
MVAILLTSATKLSHPLIKFWLGISLLFACICGGLALHYASAGEYVVDSDARQHVFWMQRFSEAGLFPDDWIANYHESVAPPGYTMFYWLGDTIGISPFMLNKLLPLVLGIITTVYGFWLCLEFLPLPFAGFVSTLLLNQTLWMRYDLVSGTPRSFVYPLFLAFLYYLLRRNLWRCLATIALQGLFYPQILLVSLGILLLRLGHSQDSKLRLTSDRANYHFCLAGLGVAFLVLLPYAMQSSEFGPAISAAQARSMPEFLPAGRTRFFHQDFWEYWFFGKRSGIMPQIEMSPLLLMGFALPLMLQLPQRFPLPRQVCDRVAILGQTVLASLGLFLIAHLLLFKLHLPSRYTMHSLLVVLAIAAGIAIVILLERLMQWAKLVSGRSRCWAIGGVALLGIALTIYPFFTGFPYTKYKRGEAPELYAFLANQPKETLVASLSPEADNIPSFAKRSVLVSDMYAIPYHVGYYREIHQRTETLIEAQYSPDLAQAQMLIQKYGIDFWLIDTDAFTPAYLTRSNWLMQYPATQTAIEYLRTDRPALANLPERCTVLESRSLRLLDARCILQTPNMRVSA